MADTIATEKAKQPGQAPVKGEGKRDPHWLQQRWLTAAKGKTIAVVLTNGQEVNGTLIASDQFTLGVKEASGDLALVYKGACAVLRRAAEGGENEPKP